VQGVGGAGVLAGPRRGLGGDAQHPGVVAIDEASVLQDVTGGVEVVVKRPPLPMPGQGCQQGQVRAGRQQHPALDGQRPQGRLDEGARADVIPRLDLQDREVEAGERGLRVVELLHQGEGGAAAGVRLRQPALAARDVGERAGRRADRPAVAELGELLGGELQLGPRRVGVALLRGDLAEHQPAQRRAVAVMAPQRRLQRLAGAPGGDRQLSPQQAALGLGGQGPALPRRVPRLALNATAAAADRSRLSLEATRQEQAAAAKSADDLAAAAQASARAIGDAFGTIGVRGVAEVEAEILQVRAAMDTVQAKSGQTGAALASAFAAGKGRIAELERELRGIRNELTLTDKAAGLFKNSLGQIAAGNVIADAVGALVERVKDLGRQFIAVNVQSETLTRGLTALYKSSATAADQIAFLRGTASAAGLSVGEISDAFVRFNASTQASNIPLAQSNELFRAVAQASSTLGLSSQRATLAIDALGQIASKGVVSMEELRQQLGDSVPGALSLTAKGLGITDAELIKLVESGKLAARDFFPAFTKGLQTLTAETDGIQSSWNRFKTSLTLVAQSIGDAGFITVLTTAIKGLGAAVGLVVVPLASFVEFVGLSGKAVLLAAVAMRGDGAAAAQMFGEEVERSAARINAMRDSVSALIDPTGEAAKRLASAGAAAAAAGAQATAASASVQALSARFTEVSADALKFETAQQAITTAQKIAGDSSVELTARYTQLSVQLGTLTTAAESEAAVRAKSTKATQEQADQLVELARLQGSEPQLVEAQITANDLLRASVEAEARAREAYAGTLAAELEAKRALAIQIGDLEQRAKLELDALAQKVSAATADAQATRAQADGYGVLRTALEANRLAYQDNAAQVAAFRAEHDRASRTLESVRAAMTAGTATAADMTAAQSAVAVAASRLNDALRDQVDKIDAVTRSKLAANALESVGLQIALAQAKSDEERARRLGNENSLRIALIRQKEIEIQIDKLKAEAMQIEASGALALAQAKRAELEASGQLTEVKRIELDTAIKLAEVRGREAELIGVTIRSREDEIARIKARREELAGEVDGTNKSTDALRENANTRDDLSGSIDRESAARGRNAEAMRREAEASDRMTSTVRGADGRTNAQRERLAGQGGPVDASLPFQIQERAARGDRFTEQDVAQIKTALASAEQNLAISQENPMAVSLAGMADMEARVLSLRQILDRATADIQTAQRSNPQQGAKPPGAPAPAPAAPAGQIVNINLGGRVSQVRVADSASAANLESVLRQLADGARTAS